MAKFITIEDVLRDQTKILGLNVVAGEGGLTRRITVVEINRPGLALGGYVEHFRAERIQIMGRGENQFCSSAKSGNENAIIKNLQLMMSRPGIPCVVVTRGQKPAKVLLDACRKAGVPLLTTSMNTAAFVGELSAYLEERLAPSTIVHGELMDVYGMGVLIQGDAGIGKSECALELLKRGHIFVSDDMVEIWRKTGGILVGSAPEPIKQFLEVRGVGIIDVKLLFGIGSIMSSARIEMVVYLEQWQYSRPERVGLHEKFTKILDQELPLVQIPVSPGRNLAVLIEVAALNQRLRFQGYYAGRVLNEKMIRKMAGNG